MDNKYYVYAIYINGSDKPFYIGKGSGRRYKRLTVTRNNECMDVIKNNDCYSKILFDGLSEEEAYKIEQETIINMKSSGIKLTNKSNGGKGNNGWIPDDAFRDKIRKIVSGSMNPNYGHKWSEDKKNALSEKLKATRDFNKGKNPKSKKVVCVETGIVYDCCIDAIDALGLKSVVSINHALKKRSYTASKMHFVQGEDINILNTESKRMKYLSNILLNQSPYTGMCIE